MAFISVPTLWRKVLNNLTPFWLMSFLSSDSMSPISPRPVQAFHASEPLGPLARLSGPDLYVALFEDSPIAILEEDWTGAKHAVDAARAHGVADFDHFLMNNPEFITAVRRTHHVVDANTAAMRLFGHTDKAEFLAQTRQLLPANPGSNSSVLRAFATGARAAQGERLLRTRDGQVVPILWRTVIPAPDGDFSRLLFYAVDVSALKQAEEALSVAQAELSRASRIAMVGEMTASIAHEINQPLGAIRLFADSAQRWLDRDDPSVTRAKRSLVEVAANADRAASIVRRVKDLVRREPPETQAVDLRQSVLDAFALLEREARQAGVSMSASIPPDLPAVQAEPIQLQQVFINLLLNAIQSMAAAQTKRGQLTVNASREAPNRIAMTVEDDGPGFALETPSKVFDPFFSTKSEGMGLGLSICRSIVEAHGGAIVASTRSEGGARFTFSLPVAAGASS